MLDLPPMTPEVQRGWHPWRVVEGNCESGRAFARGILFVFPRCTVCDQSSKVQNQPLKVSKHPNSAKVQTFIPGMIVILAEMDLENSMML